MAELLGVADRLAALPGPRPGKPVRRTSTCSTVSGTCPSAFRRHWPSWIWPTWTSARGGHAVRRAGGADGAGGSLPRPAGRAGPGRADDNLIGGPGPCSPRPCAVDRTWVVVSHDPRAAGCRGPDREIRAGSARITGGADQLHGRARRRAGGGGAVRAWRQTDLRRQRRELAEARVRSNAGSATRAARPTNVPKIVAGAKKRAPRCRPGSSRGHEADVAEAAQALRAAEDEVRDDDVITVD